jgi:Zn-dependent M28 family amino/carboxypeptidase
VITIDAQEFTTTPDGEWDVGVNFFGVGHDFFEIATPERTWRQHRGLAGFAYDGPEPRTTRWNQTEPVVRAAASYLVHDRRQVVVGDRRHRSDDEPKRFPGEVHIQFANWLNEFAAESLH